MYICRYIFVVMLSLFFFHSFNIKWFGHTHGHTHRHTVFSVVLFSRTFAWPQMDCMKFVLQLKTVLVVYILAGFSFSDHPAGCLRSSLTAWTNLVKGGMFFGVLHEARSNYAAYARAWIVLLWHTNCVVHTVRTASCGGCTGLGY